MVTQINYHVNIGRVPAESVSLVCACACVYVGVDVGIGVGGTPQFRL